MDQGIGDQKSHYGFSALEKDEVWSVGLGFNAA